MELTPKPPNATSFLGQVVTITIDRPLGSRHPQHGFIYPVNYGYLPGVILPDGDGEPLDAYVLGVDAPLAQFTGVCVAVIHRTDDRDDKLVIAPEGMPLTDAEILARTAFQERFFTSVLLRTLTKSPIQHTETD